MASYWSRDPEIVGIGSTSTVRPKVAVIETGERLLPVYGGTTENMPAESTNSEQYGSHRKWMAAVDKDAASRWWYETDGYYKPEMYDAGGHVIYPDAQWIHYGGGWSRQSSWNSGYVMPSTRLHNPTEHARAQSSSGAFYHKSALTNVGQYAYYS